MYSTRSQINTIGPRRHTSAASEPTPTPDPPRSESRRADAAERSAERSAAEEKGTAHEGAPRSEVARGETVLKSLSTNLVPELRRYVAVHRLEVERLVKEGDVSTGL